MVRLRSALLLVSVLVGCYSDRQAPPNFRHACSADGDCNRLENCISGLCQRPCTQATADEDCPSEDGFATCFNGVCVTSCELPAEECSGETSTEVCERPELQTTCTNPHRCLDLGFDLGGGGSFVGGSSDVALGVCGEWCTENSCPEGEICLENFCVAECDPAGPDTCNEAFGLSCHPTLGLCLPEIDEETPTTAESGSTEPMSSEEGSG
jgi:hypothetical protein